MSAVYMSDINQGFQKLQTRKFLTVSKYSLSLKILAEIHNVKLPTYVANAIL